MPVRDRCRTDPARTEGSGSAADASGTPVLRDQGPIGRPGTARPIKAMTPCMPCSFGLLQHARSEADAHPADLVGVTVADRCIPLVTAACGTWVPRPVRTNVLTTPEDPWSS